MKRINIFLIGGLIIVSPFCGAQPSDENLSTPKKVDIFLKDADLINATQALTRQTGIQFIVVPSKDSFEKINLSLNNVEPYAAIDYICRAAGAWAERDERGVNIIRKGLPPLNHKKQAIDNSIVQKIYLKTADAKTIYEMLIDSCKKNYPGLGEITNYTDETQNPMEAKVNPIQAAPDLKQGDSRIIESAESKRYYPVDVQTEEAFQKKPVFSRPSVISHGLNPIGENEMFQVGGNRGFGGFNGGAAPVGNLSAGQGLVPEGIEYITFDPTDNSIIAKGSPESIRKLQGNIALFDIKPQQVMIKVEYIETVLDNSSDMGMDWFGRSRSKQFTSGTVPSSISPSGTTTNTTTTNRTDSNSDSTTTDTVTQTDVNPAGIFASAKAPFFINFLDGPNLARLRAQLSNGNSKITDAPLLRTLNNQEASVEFTLTRYEQVDNSILQEGATPQIQHDLKEYPATNKLALKPRINGDGTITLYLRPQLESFENGTTATERFRKSSRTLNAVIRLKDAGTAVISGLTTKKYVYTRDSLPLIGPLFEKIPLLNVLTGRIQKKLEERNLLIFITAKVVEEDEEGLS